MKNIVQRTMDAFKNQIRDAKSAADELADVAPGLNKMATFDEAFEKTTELITRIREFVRPDLPGAMGPEERALRTSILDILLRMDGQLVAIEARPPAVEQDRAFPEMIDTVRKTLDELLLKTAQYEGGRRTRRRSKRASTIGTLKKGKLTSMGYSTTAKASTRHRALTKAMKRYGPLSTYRKLNAVAVYTKRTMPGKSKMFLEDRNWVGKHSGYKSM